MKRPRALLCAAASCVMSACLGIAFVSTTVQTYPGAEGVPPESYAAAKVFHADGTITLFPYSADVTLRAPAGWELNHVLDLFAQGATITIPDTVALTRQWVIGQGSHYSIDLTSSEPVDTLLLEGMTGIEVYMDRARWTKSVLVSVAATSLGYATAAAVTDTLPGSVPLAMVIVSSIIPEMGSSLESLARTPPTGARVWLTLSAPGALSEIQGELVAVRADGLLVLLPEGLAVVEYAALREARFEEATDLPPLPGSATVAQREKVSPYGRYAFGLTESQLGRLLDALGQERLIELGR